MDEIGSHIDLSNLCMCSICPQKPMFTTEENLFMHYKECHECSTSFEDVKCIANTDRSLESTEVTLEQDVSLSTGVFDDIDTSTIKSISLNTDSSAGVHSNVDNHSDVNLKVESRYIGKCTEMSITDSSLPDGNRYGNDAYPDTMVMCSLCNEHPIFTNEEELLVHTQEYHKIIDPVNGIANCTTPDSLPGNISDLTSNITVTSKSDLDAMVMCSMCNEHPVFTCEEELSLHLKEHHKIMDLMYGSTIGTCPEHFRNDISNTTLNVTEQSNSNRKSVKDTEPTYQDICNNIKEALKERAKYVEERNCFEDEIKSLKEKGILSDHILELLEREISVLVEFEMDKTKLIEDFEEDLERISHTTNSHTETPISILDKNLQKGTVKYLQDKELSSNESLVSSTTDIETTTNYSELPFNEPLVSSTTDIETTTNYSELPFNEPLVSSTPDIKTTTSYPELPFNKPLVLSTPDIKTTTDYPESPFNKPLVLSTPGIKTTTDYTESPFNEPLSLTSDIITTTNALANNDTRVEKWIEKQNELINNDFKVHNRKETMEIDTCEKLERKEIAVQTLKIVRNVLETQTQTEHDFDKELTDKNHYLEEMHKTLDEKVEIIKMVESQLVEYKARCSEMEKSKYKMLSLQDELEYVKSNSEIRIEHAKSNASKELEKAALKNKKLLQKLDDRGKMITDFKAEVIKLQTFCTQTKSENKEEKEASYKTFTKVNNSLTEKTKMVEKVCDKLDKLNKKNKEQDILYVNIKENKELLVKEVSELKKTIVLQKDKNNNMSKKVNKTKDILKNKIDYYNQKIDIFLETEKLLNKDLLKAVDKCHMKDEEIEEKENQILAIKKHVEEANRMKHHHEKYVDELKAEIEDSDRKRELISDRYVSLDARYKSQCQRNKDLEERNRIEHNANTSANEALKRNLKQTNEERLILKTKYDDLSLQLMEFEHRYKRCTEKNKDLEKDYKRKEMDYRDEMEIILNEQTKSQQREIEKLKIELRNFSDLEATHQNCESKILLLNEEHKQLSHSMEENLVKEKQHKAEEFKELNSLNKKISILREHNTKLNTEMERLKRKTTEVVEERKLYEEQTSIEIKEYRAELRNVRGTLHEQLLITKELQNEKENGGLAWQKEKCDLMKELDGLKNKVRDHNIGNVLLEENLNRFNREKKLTDTKHDLEEKALQVLVDTEKHKTQQIRIECNRNIEVWVQQNKELTKKNSGLTRQVEKTKTERDVEFAKLEMRLQLTEEDKKRYQLENEDHDKSVKHSKEENREMNLKIHQLEEQIKRFSNDLLNQSEKLSSVEKQLENETEKGTDVMKSREILKEKLSVLQIDYQGVSTELLNCKKYSDIILEKDKELEKKVEGGQKCIAILEKENTQLKSDINYKKIALQKGEYEVSFLKNSEKLLLDKVSKQSGMLNQKAMESSCELQALKDQIKNLHTGLSNASEYYHDKELETQYQITEVSLDTKRELQIKDAKIVALIEKISGLEIKLSDIRSKHNNVELESLKQQDVKRIEKMHKRELQRKDMKITMLREDLRQLQLKSESSYNGINEDMKTMAEKLTRNKKEIERKDREIVLLKKEIERVEETSEEKSMFIVTDRKRSAKATDEVLNKKEIQRKDKEIYFLKEKIETLEERLEENAVHNDKNTAVESIKSELELCRKEIKQKDHKINVLNKEIQIVQEKAKEVEMINSLEITDVALAKDWQEEAQRKEKEIAALKKELESLNNSFELQRSENEEDLANGRKTVVEMDKEIAELKELIEELHKKESLKANTNKKLKENKMIIAALKGEIEELKINLSETTSKLFDEKQKRVEESILNKYKKAIQEKNDNILNLQKLIENLHQTLEDLQDKLDEQESECKNKMDKITLQQRKELNALQNEFDNLKKTNEQLEMESNNIQHDHESTGDEVKKLEEKVKYTLVELDQEKEKNMLLIQKVSNVQNDLTLLQTEMKTNEINQKKTIENLIKEKEELNEKIKKVKHEIKDKSQNEEENDGPKVESLKKKNKKLKKEVGSIKVELQEARSTSYQQQKQNQEKLKELKENVASVEEKLQIEKKETENAKEKIKLLEEQTIKLEVESKYVDVCKNDIVENETDEAIKGEYNENKDKVEDEISLSNNEEMEEEEEEDTSLPNAATNITANSSNESIAPGEEDTEDIKTSPQQSKIQKKRDSTSSLLDNNFYANKLDFSFDEDEDDDDVSFDGDDIDDLLDGLDAIESKK